MRVVTGRGLGGVFVIAWGGGVSIIAWALRFMFCTIWGGEVLLTLGDRIVRCILVKRGVR